MASVAVVIVTWNAAGVVGEALEALARQTVRPERVVVVDNGSADVSKLELMMSAYPDWVLVKSERNLGFAAANNLGFRYCGSVDFIALLNPDAFPRPEWLERLVAAHERHPGYACFASRQLVHSDDSILDGAGDYLTLAGKPGRRGYGKRAAGKYLNCEPIFSPCAAAALYTRRALEACGGFDERFFCYVEDVDLGYRLLLAGYRSLYVADAIVNHMGSALTGKRSEFAVYHGQRNLILNYVKNMPGPLFWGLLPVHLLANVIMLAGCVLGGSGHAAWRAKTDALRLLPDMWRSRRVVQAGRKISVLDVLRRLRISML